MFWLLALPLACVAGLFVLLPVFLKGAREDAGAREQMNLSIYREKLTALQEEVPADRASLELEARRDLLSDTAGPGGFRATVGDNRISIAAAFLPPVLAVLMYADIGLGRGALPDLALTDMLQKLGTPDGVEYRIFVDSLAERLRQKPGDTDLQYLMARALGNLGRIDEAVKMYADLIAVHPDNANLASHYAEALFVANGSRLTQAIDEAVERALALNPADLTMLEIKAVAAMAAKDDAAAMMWFERALQTGVTGRRAELIRRAMSMVEEVSALASDRTITVTVTAADEVRLPPESVVFVYARGTGDSPAPLAVRRLSLGELPAEVLLDDSMAMIQGMSLGDFDQVIVVARVSASGDAMRMPGDYEARSGVIDLSPGSASISLNISEALE